MDHHTKYDLLQSGIYSAGNCFFGDSSDTSQWGQEQIAQSWNHHHIKREKTFQSDSFSTILFPECLLIFHDSLSPLFTSPKAILAFETPVWEPYPEDYWERIDEFNTILHTDSVLSLLLYQFQPPSVLPGTSANFHRRCGNRIRKITGRELMSLTTRR